jgi:hypothetical protein
MCRGIAFLVNKISTERREEASGMEQKIHIHLPPDVYVPGNDIEQLYIAILERRSYTT